MGGFSVITGDQFGSVMNADNASFDGTSRGGVLTTDGQFWIGNSVSPRVRVGTITSPLGTLTIGYSAPNITIDLSGGGTGIDSIGVDASTPPGTDPVVPDLNGLITITGGQVAAGVIGANVIRTDSLAANTFTIEIQRTAAVAISDSVNNGVSHFNSSQFTVDANGFVEANGSGIGQTITGNLGTPLSPVGGNWNLFGTATNGIETDSTGPNFIISMNSPYADGDFSFESQAGGVTRTLTVQNTVDAASSQATQNIQVAGATSGDVWSQYTIGAVRSYAWGIDNSDSDFLKLTTNNSGTIDPSSGTEIMHYDATNNVTIFGGGTPSISPSILGAVRSINGGASTFEVQNLSNTTGSGVNVGLRSGGTSSGDLSYAWNDTGTQTWFFGIAEADRQGLQMGTGGSLPTGGVQMWRLDANGWITMPLQPTVIAFKSADTANATGNGTVVTIVANTEITDTNSDYNNATGVFTSPVTGTYYANLLVTNSILGTSTGIIIDLVTSNRTYRHVQNDGAVVGGADTAAHQVYFTMDMDVGDTASWQETVSGAGGDTVSIRGSASPHLTMVEFGLLR